MADIDMQDLLDWVFDKGEEAGRSAEALRVRQELLLELKIRDIRDHKTEINRLEKEIAKLNGAKIKDGEIL